MAETSHVGDPIVTFFLILGDDWKISIDHGWSQQIYVTIWLFNTAMENHHF